MQLSRSIEYAAGIARVHAMVTDREFHERKCVESGAPRHSVRIETLDVEGIGEMTTVHTSRTVPTADLPAFVRSAAGERLTVDEHYEWRPLVTQDPGAGDNLADMTLRIAGAPVTLTGRIELVPLGPERTSMRVTADLRASVPLMGRKIEGAVLPVIDAQLENEERVGAAWLAGD